MATTLAAWKAGESVQLPCLTALRHGRGDRSGWRFCDASVLLLEGWFVGCEPLDENDEIHRGSEHLDPPLQDGEFEYRPMVQTALKAYRPTWSLIDHLWQIQAQISMRHPSGNGSRTKLSSGNVDRDFPMTTQGFHPHGRCSHSIGELRAQERQRGFFSR